VETTQPTLHLRAGKEKAVLSGYPWIFSNQLARVDGSPKRGDIVVARASSGDALGQFLYHDASLIAGRLVSRDAGRSIDQDFWAERLDAAIDRRRSAYGDATHCRLVYGESDDMPGTVIDRYGPAGLEGGVLTFTTLSAGMDMRRDILLDHLERRLRPHAIVERNDAPLRAKDGLEERTGVLRGTVPDSVVITEAGVSFVVDVLGGPKTGFFIDQRDNRAAVARLAAGRRLLDVFCADGGFGLVALTAGAESAHFLDAAAPALERVRHNAEANGLGDRVSYERADALDRMGTMAAEARGRFDLIVLDPPGFARSRRDVESATRAYQRLNISALQMLEPGGILATSSCSQAIGEDDFLRIIHYSARRAGVHLRRLYRGGHAPDHPTLEAMPETQYLKFFVFEVAG
jgi:23S rRNA (cytosine1962-C5)-methyltransferase